MFGDDDRPHEPEEPDPESDLPDYEEEFTSVPEAPSVPDPSENLGEGDAPTYVKEYFWRVVIVVDYAIAAVCIGPMFLFFRNDLRVGGLLTASGVLAFAYAYYLYRQFRATDERERDEGDEMDEGRDADTAGDADVPSDPSPAAEPDE